MIKRSMKKIIQFMFYFFVLSSPFIKNYHVLATNDNECSICSDDLYGMNEDIVTLSCHKKHKFHISCLYQWIANKTNPSCPFCRRDQTCTENPEMHFASYILKKEPADEDTCSCLQFFPGISHN